MAASHEEAVLQLAVEEGHLSAEDLERLDLRPQGESRLEFAVRTGLLNSELARRLEEQVRQAPTLPVVAGRKAECDDHWPVRHWSRYRFLEVVGSGSMGCVYKAWDPELSRVVALKFLVGHDARLIERFKREAQAQARVEHDHICPVYEVGEVDDRHYIAMKFIEGGPLSEVGRRMNLEQKIHAIKAVAEALHEAHRAGLVHRDVKPGNIMVEESSSGERRPWVVDFGLARQSEAPGMTASGAVMGTPQYMAPEQARGQIGLLDRRTDVYGLGATLYRTLTGRAPFDGDEILDVLKSVVEEVPRSPRQVRPEIPRAIESITMKCLRKNPDERYGSARELAEDLGRYLNGEAVTAGSTGLFYRIRMKAAKRRLEVVTATVALLLLAGTGGWGLTQKWRSVRVSRIAQAFGQHVESVEALARHAALAPLHDTRAERAGIRDRMSRIETEMEQLGKIATGPGHYALGRGYLALEVYESARHHLQIAWDSGFREAETAYALGRVLGTLHREAERRATYLPERKLREAELQRIDREYLEPALQYLRLGVDVDSDAPAFGEALLAYYEGEQAEALHKARIAFEGRSWFYEAKQLEGEVHEAVAHEQAAQGDPAAAAVAFGRAEAAFQAAITIGSSDSGVYLALANLHYRMMLAEISNRGADVGPYFREGLQAVDLSLAAWPENVEALNLKAALHRRGAEDALNRGRDPLEFLKSSVAAAEKSLEIRPEQAAALSQLGATYRQWAKLEQGQGRDPSLFLDRAITSFERARELDPASVGYSSRGLVFKSRANWLLSKGEDPRDALESSIQAFRVGLEGDPESIALHHNLGLSYAALARYESSTGVDPRESMAHAVAACRSALEVNPDQLIILYGLGSVLNDRARYALKRGQDPTPYLEDALEAYGRAIDVNPRSGYAAHLHDGRGVAFSLLADHARETGLDPEEAFRQATEEFEQAIEANSNHIFAHNNLASLCVARAEYAIDVSGDLERCLQGALAACARALRINPSFVWSLVTQGHAHGVRADGTLERRMDPTTHLQESREALIRAIEINPRFARAFLFLGTAASVEARWLAARGGDPTAQFAEADRLLGEAIRLDPGDQWARLALGDLRKEEARWHLSCRRAPESEIESGLAATEEALAISPGWGRALALRAVLLRCAAECSEEEERRRELLGEARASLEEALSRNGHLRRRYETESDRIRTASRGS